MAWHYTLATGIAALMSVTFAAAIPTVGSAATLSSISPFEQAHLQATVEAYSGFISSRYSQSPAAPIPASSFVDVSHISHDYVTRTSNDEREVYREDGYDVVSASVTPVIRWEKKDSNGTLHLIADLTTDMQMVPRGESVTRALVALDCSSDSTTCLDSALTDRHVMTVRPEKNSSTGMRIIFDRVLNDAEYQESLALAPESSS